MSSFRTHEQVVKQYTMPIVDVVKGVITLGNEKILDNSRRF
jgi:hypothetical protein